MGELNRELLLGTSSRNISEHALCIEMKYKQHDCKENLMDFFIHGQKLKVTVGLQCFPILLFIYFLNKIYATESKFFRGREACFDVNVIDGQHSL